MLEIGISQINETTVNNNNTAIALGSGDLEVFATPAMVALMEGAAMKAIALSLDEGSTSVGTEISTSHIKASGIGAQIVAKATVTAIEGRKVSFRVEAHQGEELIGEGVHTRFVVDKVKFMNKISSL